MLRRWAPSSEDFDTLWAKHPSSLGKVRLLGWRPSLFFMSSPRLSFSGPSHSFSAFSVFRGSSSERKLLFTGISNPLVLWMNVYSSVFFESYMRKKQKTRRSGATPCKLLPGAWHICFDKLFGLDGHANICIPQSLA